MARPAINGLGRRGKLVLRATDRRRRTLATSGDSTPACTLFARDEMGVTIPLTLPGDMIGTEGAEALVTIRNWRGERRDPWSATRAALQGVTTPAIAALLAVILTLVALFMPAARQTGSNKAKVARAGLFFGRWLTPVLAQGLLVFGVVFAINASVQS